MSVGVSMGCMSSVCACVVYSRASSVCICGGKGVRQFKNLGSGVREASTGVLPHHIAVHPTQIIELSFQFLYPSKKPITSCPWTL